jgi:hypothetical protein
VAGGELTSLCKSDNPIEITADLEDPTAEVGIVAVAIFGLVRVNMPTNGVLLVVEMGIVGDSSVSVTLISSACVGE